MADIDIQYFSDDDVEDCNFLKIKLKKHFFYSFGEAPKMQIHQMQKQIATLEPTVTTFQDNNKELQQQ